MATVRARTPTFKLSAKGEAVVLSDADANGNTLIDAVNFAALGEDEAYGRSPNGSSLFRTLSATPGAANLLLPALAIETEGNGDGRRHGHVHHHGRSGAGHPAWCRWARPHREIPSKDGKENESPGRLALQGREESGSWRLLNPRAEGTSGNLNFRGE